MNNNQSNSESIGGRHERSYKFEPRIINPKRLQHAVFFAANELVRNAHRVLGHQMPWLHTHILNDPFAVSQFVADAPTVFIFDDTALHFVDTAAIRNKNKDAMMVLVSSNETIHCSPPHVTLREFPYTEKADLIFAVNNSDLSADEIITSVVKSAEDRINIQAYSRARRYIYLLVEDEPCWISEFLPVLYHIIGQRADVWLARTFEETLDFLFGVNNVADIEDDNFQHRGHGDDVVCVISDMYFPKDGKLSADAGKELSRLLNKYYPRITKMIASTTDEGYRLDQIDGVMAKGDPGSLETLRQYIYDYTGMQDFLIRDKSGEVLYRIRNIQELYDMLNFAAQDTKEARSLRKILNMYGQKDHFSTWLYMHGHRDLGDRVRPKHHTGKPMVTYMRRNIQREMLRTQHTPLKIDNQTIFTLQELNEVFTDIEPITIQHLSDIDVFSTWFDRKGYSELAEEFRPIHGSGPELVEQLKAILEKWIEIYEREKRF